MKLLLKVLIITMLFSCERKEYMEVYLCEPISNDSVIRGHSLNKFFEIHDNSRKIHQRRIRLTKNLNNEIEKTKDYLRNNGNVDKGIGIYFFAIIQDNDTLYAGSELESWKYKNFVAAYKSELIKKTLLEAIGDASN